jgi:hypothetical protein
MKATVPTYDKTNPTTGCQRPKTVMLAMVGMRRREHWLPGE